ncbi:MAG: XRE family transcriptional regulator [Myxococcales bacterium]|nr:MAG: XRE family transcriptional regulator [Myxococcales bacterium]
MNKLRKWRRREKLSLTDVASRLAVTKGAVSRWENGNRTPSRPLLFAIETMTGGEVPAKGWL